MIARLPSQPIRTMRLSHWVYVGAATALLLLSTPGIAGASQRGSGHDAATAHSTTSRITAATLTAATTASTTPGPTLALTATSPVFVETSPDTWSVRVILTTTSGCPERLWFWIVLPSNQIVRASSYTYTTTTGSLSAVLTVLNGAQGTPCAIPVWQTTPVAVNFNQLDLGQPPSTATLVVSQAEAGAGATSSSPTTGPGGPTSIVVTTQQFLPWTSALVWPLVGGAGFAVGVLVIIVICLRRKSLSAVKKLNKTPVFASAAWTFKDSWTTNITAAGALIGTFLTATGSVTSVFPGVPLYRFSLLSAFCGGVVVIAPLLFGIFGTPQLDRYKTPRDERVVASLLALLVAAGCTLFGVGAGLAFLSLLIFLSAAQTTFMIILLVGVSLTAAVIVRYAVKSTVTLCTSSANAQTSIDGARDVQFVHGQFAEEVVAAVQSVRSTLAPPSGSSLTL
jgi:hypothetical protein